MRSELLLPSKNKPNKNCNSKMIDPHNRNKPHIDIFKNNG
jgi:hypothetical protein